MPRATAQSPTDFVPIPPRLAALADGLPLGLLVVRDGRVAYANGVAERQWQSSAGQLEGIGIETLFEHADLARELASHAPPVDVEARLRRTDGEVFRAEVNLRQLDEDHRLLVVCDKTESDRTQARQREELQAMTRRVLSVQEDERRTLSRELHDDIGQQITAIKLGALALQHEDDAQRRDETLAEIIATADQTMAKIRNLSLLLRPPQLDALGLEAALRWQAETLFRSGRPHIELSLSPLPQRLPAEVELAAFRIAQESLTNVLRHADAREVHVVLEQRGAALHLSVCDDGCGFHQNYRPGGLGLATMRERAEQLGGRLSVETGRTCGTCIRVELPVAPA